ncbi:MAG: 5-formyltetrahydrofolate cyclo-ligase [Sphingomonas sp.]|nr:5-formyltetrahydrofolate cyclo-ligase [Sphingomonas sp.]
MVVPSPPFLSGPIPEMDPLSKESLRRLALDARKAFVATISDAERTLLEQRLAQKLTSLCSEAKVVGGYAPLGSEISPLLAIEEARAVGRIVAYPAFDHPAKPFKFRAGDPLEPGPFGIMQPKSRAPVVEPDLILVPLIAIDGNGTRLGRGKGHYDRALARLKKSGARLVGVGWGLQRLVETIPTDEWDVPLDAFASPEGLEIFRR